MLDATTLSHLTVGAPLLETADSAGRSPERRAQAAARDVRRAVGRYRARRAAARAH
jgi:hypothetical protein